MEQGPARKRKLRAIKTPPFCSWHLYSYSCWWQRLAELTLVLSRVLVIENNTTLRSEDSRKTGEEPVFRFKLRGRTDRVRVFDNSWGLGKSNNRNFIEIKRKSDFKIEESFREAAMQLIGGNISNSFHSPPVLLTDLVENQCYEQFDLNIVRMPTFGIAALAFVEERTSAMRFVTTLLQDSPTRRKPRNSSSVEEEDDEEDSKDVGYKFDSSLDIVPIVTDDWWQGWRSCMKFLPNFSELAYISNMTK
jgi:hypothetical protein